MKNGARDTSTNVRDRKHDTNLKFNLDVTSLIFLPRISYLVTLNALSSLTHLSTERPSGGMTSFLVRMSSRILLITTKQSKRLKRETK